MALIFGPNVPLLAASVMPVNCVWLLAWLHYAGTFVVGSSLLNTQTQLLGAMLQAGNSGADPGNSSGSPSGLKMVGITSPIHPSLLRTISPHPLPGC